jgi:hypothetical protein
MASTRKYIYRCSIACFLVIVLASAKEFVIASHVQQEQPKQVKRDSTLEKRNQLNASPTMTEGMQTMVPVAKEMNAQLRDGWVEFPNWIKADEDTFMLRVDVRKEVAKAKGQIVKTELDGTVCFTADNGIFVVFPAKDGRDSSRVLSSFGEGKILSKYINVANKTLVVVTDNEIGITNQQTAGFVLFSDLNEKTPVKDAQVAQDPKDPDCAIVTGNGKTIARVHTNASNPNEMVELTSEPIRKNGEVK